MAVITKEAASVTPNKIKFGSKHQGLSLHVYSPPDGLDTHTSLDILPGFFANRHHKVFQRAAEDLASCGIETTVYTFRGWHPGQKLTQSARSWGFEATRYGNIQANKAAAFLDFLAGQAEQNPDSYRPHNVAGHSLEAQTALLATAAGPDLINATLLITPTGGSSEYPMRHLARRFTRQSTPETRANLRDTEARHPTVHLIIAGLKATAFHPIATMVWERRAIQGNDLTGVFNTITQSPSSPPLYVLVAENDIVFGPEEQAFPHTTLPGYHNDFSSRRWTKAIDERLHMLNGGSAQ